MIFISKIFSVPLVVDFWERWVVDISNLLKTSIELKIVSGFDNWLNRLKAVIAELSSSDEQTNNSEEKIQSL